MTRVTALLLAVVSLVATAQAEPAPLPLPPPPPPLVTTEPSAPAASCASNAECARGEFCAGFREVSPGKWSRGTCQSYQQQPQNAPPPECTSTEECAQGSFCGDFRNLGDGKWSKGICMPSYQQGPQPNVYAPPAATTRTGRAQRFDYTGTVPPGYRLVSQPRSDLLTAGAITFGISYGVMVIISVVGQNYLGMIPLIGPIFFMARDLQNGGTNVLSVTFGVSQIAAQGVGAGLIIAGAVLKRQWLELSPVAGGPRLMLLPSAAGAPLGASVVGQF